MIPQKLTLIQRLQADTPDFFKKVDLFGLFLIGLATSLSGTLPVAYTIGIASVGGTLTVISKFAVKDAAAISALAANPDPAAIAQTVLDLMNQAKEVKDDVQNIAKGVPAAAPAPEAASSTKDAVIDDMNSKPPADDNGGGLKVVTDTASV